LQREVVKRRSEARKIWDEETVAQFNNGGKKVYQMTANRRLNAFSSAAYLQRTQKAKNASAAVFA
jgi:hypothetical protein